MSGTWSPLTNQPSFGGGTMLLLTDGAVMVQNSGTAHWWKLTPDPTGSYVNGTWTALADGPNGPLYFASAVLRDGRVFVAGGEYPGDLLAAEIYNPLTNAWTSLATPAGWTHIGDASGCVFPDGRVMIGSIEDNRCAIYDPVANAWTAAANKNNATTNEETWTLLWDETILTADCNGHPQTEKYIIAADKWILTGNTPQDLVEAASIEIGPALLLPDGRVFAIGATGHTALYTPPAIASQVGSWAAGPTFPVVSGKQLGAKDAPGVLLPNGNVLCAVGPVDGVGGDFLSPTYFYEYDPAANTLNAVATPPTSGGPPFVGRFLLLPTGQALFVNGSSNVQVYTPSGSPDPVWKPTITSVPGFLQQSHTYTLNGRQINGLSQANSYGDDAQMATNYPLVRLQNTASGHVFYCRTFNHSTMGVNTGTVIHSTQFTVPAGVPNGAATVTVVANGIASDPVHVTVGVIKLKEIKELKLEIKEIKEVKEKEIKEIKELEKLPVENLKLVVENNIKNSEGGDLINNMLTAMGRLAERIDQSEVEKAQQRSFIQPEERPDVGPGLGPKEAKPGDVPEKLPPPSQPNLKKKP